MGYHPGRSKLGLAKQMRMKQLADYLASKGHFNSEEVLVLLNIFHKFTSINGNRLDRLRFRAFFHTCLQITDDIQLDLLFHAFDKSKDGTCDEEEFVNGLSTLLRGTLEEQIELAYKVYDMNGDGSLAREELHHCLKGCIRDGYGVPTDEIDDAERDIVEMVMRKLDYNRDGQITQEDFLQAVQRDPLLLSSIGPCFPEASGMASFLALISEDHRTYSQLWMARNRHQSRLSKDKGRIKYKVTRPTFMQVAAIASSHSMMTIGHSAHNLRKLSFANANVKIAKANAKIAKVNSNQKKTLIHNKKTAGKIESTGAPAKHRQSIVQFS